MVMVQYVPTFEQHMIDESKLGNLARSTAMAAGIALGYGSMGEMLPKSSVPISQTAQSDQTKEFIEDVGQRESSDRWDIIKGEHSDVPYVGKYQFGTYALKDVGRIGPNTRFKKMSDFVHAFKRNPGKVYPEAEQYKDMVKLMKRNSHYLRNYMDYVGDKIKDVEVTVSGMLAASHLVGSRAVKDFLESGGKKDKADGNGVKCSHYMKEFGGYNVNLNEYRSFEYFI